MSLNPADPDDPEPYPWLRSRARSTLYALPGLRHPLGSIIYGCVFIGLGIWTLQAGLALTGGDRTLIVLVSLLPLGLGVWSIIIGVRRWGWYYRFRQRHGYPPL